MRAPSPPHITHLQPKRRSSEQGFSLLELLVAITIIGVLAGFTLPAFNAIGAAQGVTQGIYDVSSLLELARKEAMTRQTYVWVGFQSADVNGGKELWMAAASSRDGTDNTAQGNLIPLTRIVKIKNVALSPWSDLKSDTRRLYEGGSPASIAENSSGVSFSIGPVKFADRTVTFTPSGQAMLTGSPGLDGGYDPLMEISFRQLRSGTVSASADDASIFLNGSTGTTRILRLE
jgi:prepilin-type N-terminal cleavage/methylation domain-containing protein